VGRGKNDKKAKGEMPMPEITEIKLKYGHDYHTIAVPTKNLRSLF
jgi:hypothetical protein